MKNNNNKKMPRKYMYISVKQHSSYLYHEFALFNCDATCVKL